MTLHPAGNIGATPLELGEVVAVDDPEGLNRVKVRFLSRGPEAGDGANGAQSDATAWAAVAVAFAGDRMGAFLLPGVGARVVLGSLNGDPRYPVVLGTIWDGSTESPETLGGDGTSVDRWSLTGKAGTRIAIVEEGGTARIEIETPHGNRMVIDDSGASLTLTQGGNTITMDSTGIKLDSHTIELSAAIFKLTAAMATFETPLATFSGIVTTSVTQANSVVSASYTPGAGNML